MKDLTIDLMLKLFNEKYEINEIDVGEFKNIKAGPMKFEISQYNIKNVGNLSIMKGSAMLGLMKMDTMILCSFSKDAPIFSYDRIHAMGNDTLIYELYDSYINPLDLTSLGNVKQEYSEIPNYELKKCWYDEIKLPESVSKRAKGKLAKNMNNLVIDYFKEYLNILDNAPECDVCNKKPLVDKYTQGLLTNGGSSTDVFIKYIGKEKTTELFEKILFASK